MKSVRLLIGYLQRAHGVRGEILTRSLTDDDARFTEGMKCFLVKDRDAEPYGEVTISNIRITPSGPLLALRGCEDRETARAMRLLPCRQQEDAIELRDDDEFYTGDLVGARVIDRALGDLGELVDFISAGDRGARCP